MTSSGGGTPHLLQTASITNLSMRPTPPHRTTGPVIFMSQKSSESNKQQPTKQYREYHSIPQKPSQITSLDCICGISPKSVQLESNFSANSQNIPHSSTANDPTSCLYPTAHPTRQLPVDTLLDVSSPLYPCLVDLFLVFLQWCFQNSSGALDPRSSQKTKEHSRNNPIQSSGVTGVKMGNIA